MAECRCGMSRLIHSLPGGQNATFQDLCHRRHRAFHLHGSHGFDGLRPDRPAGIQRRIRRENPAGVCTPREKDGPEGQPVRNHPGIQGHLCGARLPVVRAAAGRQQHGLLCSSQVTTRRPPEPHNHLQDEGGEESPPRDRRVPRGWLHVHQVGDPDGSLYGD